MPAPNQTPHTIETCLVLLDGAPPIEPLAARLRTEAVVLLDATSAFAARGPAPRPLVIVWAPADAPIELYGELVAWGRRTPGTAILGCAPQGTFGDSERALGAGFDDFVAGSASARELAGRLRALQRRLAVRPAAEELRFGAVTVDRARHELWIEGRCVTLTVRELALVATLVEARGRALSREALLDAVWGADTLDVSLRSVDNLVMRVRRKLGRRGVIVTVRGLGFRLADS